MNIKKEAKKYEFYFCSLCRVCKYVYGQDKPCQRLIVVKQGFEDGYERGFSDCELSKKSDKETVNPIKTSNSKFDDFFNSDIRLHEKYRPYRNIDEFITDYCDKKGVEISSLEYPIIWLRGVNSNIVRMITEYSPVDNTVRTGDYWSNFQELLENYTYLGGSRCGIKS